jgi:hypothetical protein
MRINTSRMWEVGHVARMGKKRKPRGLLVEILNKTVWTAYGQIKG